VGVVSFFAGRGPVLDDIDAWLAGDSPYLLVLGEPGAGKTALARHVADISAGLADAGTRSHLRAGAITYPHFCRAWDASAIDPMGFVGQLSLAIAHRWQPYAQALSTLRETGQQAADIYASASAGTVETGGISAAIWINELRLGSTSAALALERWVRKPLSEMADVSAEPFIVLVDALDEALTFGVAATLGEETIVSVLSDALEHGRLPSCLRFLMTSRPDERVTDRLLRLHGPVVDLGEDVGAAVRDVQEYALDRLSGHPERRPEQLSARVAQASAGNFLYARYALDDLLEGGAESASSGTLPANLDDIYTRFIERELARTDQLWRSLYRPVLGLLTVAQGAGLPRDVLAGASRLPESSVDDALRDLSQYLDVRAESAPVRIYHESFREFISKEGKHSVYPREAELALVRWFLDGLPVADPDGQPGSAAYRYAQEYLATHAVAVGLLEDVIDAGFLAYAEPLAMRRALRTSRSSFQQVYEGALPALVDSAPVQRALALRLTALRAGDRAMDERLARLLPESAIRPVWAAVDPYQLPTWSRPSLAVNKLTVGEVGGRLTIAILEDLATAPVLWEPETGAERAVRVAELASRGEFLLTVLAGRPALIQAGSVTVAADAVTGEILGRARSYGPTAFLVHRGQAWLAEASLAGGTVWVRPLGSADLWEENASSLMPSAAQRALEPVAHLDLPGQKRIRRLYPIATEPDPTLAAVTEDGELYLIDPFSAGSPARRAACTVDRSVEKPLAAADDGRPMLAVAVEDRRKAVMVLDTRTGEQVAGLDWTELSAALENLIPVKDVSGLEAVTFMAGAATPELLISLKDFDAVLTWSVASRQLGVFFMPDYRSLHTVRHEGKTLVVVTRDSGIEIFESASVLAQLSSVRGPVSVMAAATVNGRPLVSWLAPAYGFRSVLWTVDGDGREIDRVELAGPEPEFLAIGENHGTPIAVALADRYRGRCYARWLDGSRRTIEIHPGSAWPGDLAGFALADFSPVQDESELNWAEWFLSLAAPELMPRQPGQRFARVAVAIAGERAASVWHELLSDGDVVTGNILGRVILHIPGVAHDIEIRPVPGPAADTAIGNLAVTVTGKGTSLAATINQSVARRLVVTVRHDDEHDPRWQPVTTSQAYEGHLALGAVSCGVAMALGDGQRGVRLFAPLEPEANPPRREYFIPQPATALHFADTSHLVIGTARGLICLSVDAIKGGQTNLTGIALAREKGWGCAMADPFTAAAIGGVVLTEGIKFLYKQAGEVLKRWRERRDTGGVPAESATLRPPEGLLEGTVEPVEPKDDQAERLEQELRETRRLLADYAEGIETPKPGDHLVVEQADALRRLLEAAYGQRITFKGEQRPPSGPLVTGEIDVKEVAGDAAAVRAKVISSGEVRGTAKADRVEQGGKLTGVEADRIE